MGAVAARVKREAVVISRARSINVSSKARLDLVETRLMTAHSFSPNTRHMNASKTEKTAKTGLICIARIKGAFGVKGEVRIQSFTQNAEDCFGFGPLLGTDGRR